MLAPQRRHPAGLIDGLLAEPHRFEFFQAVRLLDRWLADAGAAPRASRQALPQQLRFRNSLSLSFPASEIESLRVVRRPAEEGAAQGALQRIEITPAFIGLLGGAGALPLVYTEQMVQREMQQKDGGARAFLDVFSHRATAMFYAAWKKHRLHLQYETEHRHRYLPLVLSLAGVGPKALHDRLRAHQGGVADESLAFFAGALQRRQLSAVQIERLLSRYLQVPVTLAQFQGRWYPLPRAACTSLGVGDGRQQGTLGRNALAGERVWQRDLRVKLTLGPLAHVSFRRFLPGAPGALALRELLTLLSGVGLEYEVNLALRADAVQGGRLDTTRSPLAGRLGWDTYLATRPSAVDRCDVRYDIHGAIPAQTGTRLPKPPLSSNPCPPNSRR